MHSVTGCEYLKERFFTNNWIKTSQQILLDLGSRGYPINANPSAQENS